MLNTTERYTVIPYENAHENTPITTVNREVDISYSFKDINLLPEEDVSYS